jgi:hypothetical protein
LRAGDAKEAGRSHAMLARASVPPARDAREPRFPVRGSATIAANTRSRGASTPASNTRTFGADVAKPLSSGRR